MDLTEKKELLLSIIDKESEIKLTYYKDPSFIIWKKYADRVMGKLYNENSIEYKQYIDIKYLYKEDKEAQSPYYETNINTCKRGIYILNGLISDLIKEIEEINDKNLIFGSKIFIVHGRDPSLKIEVARFIEKLGLKAIILHEQPNKGKTIIEKFEANTEDIGYAIVLLTPDDEGHLIGDSELNPRARQNVILELGYMIGKLGRNRVCALKKEEVEIPSDFYGVLYEDYDEKGAWKLKIAKELDELSFPIDWKKI